MSWLRRLLRPLATFLSFVASFMFVGAAHDWLPGWTTPAIFGLILLIITFVIFIHELGHALAFRWQGGVVDEFAVFFLAWRRARPGQPGGLGWARRIGADIGGYVIGHFGATVPTRRKAMLVAAAGPLANFLLTFFCLVAGSAIYGMTVPDPSPGPALTVVAGGPSDAMDHAELPDAAAVRQALDHVDRMNDLAALQALLVLVGFNSLITGLINLIPFTGGDGAAILRQWLNRPSLR